MTTSRPLTQDGRCPFKVQLFCAEEDQYWYLLYHRDNSFTLRVTLAICQLKVVTYLHVSLTFLLMFGNLLLPIMTIVLLCHKPCTWWNHILKI